MESSKFRFSCKRKGEADNEDGTDSCLSSLMRILRMEEANSQKLARKRFKKRSIWWNTSLPVDLAAHDRYNANLRTCFPAQIIIACIMRTYRALEPALLSLCIIDVQHTLYKYSSSLYPVSSIPAELRLIWYAQAAVLRSASIQDCLSTSSRIVVSQPQPQPQPQRDRTPPQIPYRHSCGL